MNTLIIQHIEDSDPPSFQVRRSDHKTATPVAVNSPFAMPVRNRPDSTLMQELPWYLERFLDYPFDPYTERAENVIGALRKWGTETFTRLFGQGDAGNWMFAAKQAGYENLHLQIMSDDPRILQWPWEALYDPKASYIAINCQIERRVNGVDDPMPIPSYLPTDRINILLVTARPYMNDVSFRSISRPLVELIEKKGIPARVTVLRPPTFDNLLRHLRSQHHYYHILHFDGHGGYGRTAGGGQNQHTFAGLSEGVLVFENEDGSPNHVSASQLNGLLREVAVPAVVLNACQSAMLDQGAQDPFASVAASLIKAGIRTVTAMAYSLYVSGAREFLPAFYSELFASGDISKATRAGRQKMFEQRNRVCARGRHELEDFIIPVIYQQDPLDFSFISTGTAEVIVKSDLPDEARETQPFDFVGRDQEILKLERAIRRNTPAILIHGLSGVGKTSLARGFVKWLNDTGGMTGCVWITFTNVRSAEFVMNTIGMAIAGREFLAEDLDRKVEILASELGGRRYILVWDNFEVVAGVPEMHMGATLPQQDRALLLHLLERIRGGESKVIITSRSAEEWLGLERVKISIGGLKGEERWEHCDKITGELGIEINREDSSIVDLMASLNGHPLAMRVILPRLERMSARQLIDALKSNWAALESGAEPLYGALQIAVENLSDELRPLLIPLSLFEQYLPAGLLEVMADRVDKTLTTEVMARFLTVMVAAGLLWRESGSRYELHPALTGYLRSTLPLSQLQEDRKRWARAFVDVFGVVGDQLARAALHQQRILMRELGGSLHSAIAEADRLTMTDDKIHMLQGLVSYAMNSGDNTRAQDLLEQIERSIAGDDDYGTH